MTIDYFAGIRSRLNETSARLNALTAFRTSGTPLFKAGGQGNDLLDVPQRGAVIGDVIPIVFARRVSGVGGVLISPAATEARFSDSLGGDVSASYHLVLGEGPMDLLQVRDVFQRSCRVGIFTQTYNKRAGTFLPGNFISNTPNLEAPSYCGTGGTYEGLSTMAFSVTIPEGFDYWNRQVHCFVRGGLHVTRLLDSVTGPSNNVADLLRYLLRSSSRVPDAQVDAAGSFLAAATFTNVNGFWFNGIINTSNNLRDWASSNLQYFLLRLSRVAGKESLIPLLPVNSDGTIKTTAVDWEFAFTEKHIIPDSFEIDYTPLADRKPFVVTVLWRQQDDLGIPLIRTTEVRYAGTAEDGPYEQHDLSAFCASENHAVKVGTYILSRRNHITHQLTIGVKPDAYNPTLAVGDRVRVRLERIPSTGAASAHDYLYEVDRISRSLSGDVRLELTHFPIDDSFASVVAKEVDAAVGAGFVLPTGLSEITCDVNSSSDTSVPADTSLDPDDWDIPDEEEFVVDVTELEETELDDMPADSVEDLQTGGTGGLGGLGGGGGGDAAENNPDDDLGDQQGAPPLPMQSCPVPGGAPAVPPSGICEGAVVTRRIGNIGEFIGLAITQRGGEELYSIPLTPPEELGESSSWDGRYVQFFWICPDGTAQFAEPCENPGPKDWPDFDDYEINLPGGRTVTITNTSQDRSLWVGCLNADPITDPFLAVYNNLGNTYDWDGQTYENTSVLSNVVKIEIDRDPARPIEDSRPCGNNTGMALQLIRYKIYFTNGGSQIQGSTVHFVATALDDNFVPHPIPDYTAVSRFVRTSRVFGTSVIDVAGIGPIYPDPNTNSVTYET
jgi:hypothetical protein